MKKLSLLFIGTILATTVNAQLPTRTVKSPSNAVSSKGIKSTPPVHTPQPSAPQGVPNQRPNLREDMMQGSTNAPAKTKENPLQSTEEIKSPSSEKKLSGGPIQQKATTTQRENSTGSRSSLPEKRSTLSSGLSQEKTFPKNKETQFQRKESATRPTTSGGLPETK